MMGEIFFALMRLAVWLDPQDAASVFMWLTIGSTVLVLLVLFLVVQAIDRRRDRINLTTDVEDDPLSLGDYVHLPPMPPVKPTLGRRP